MEKDRAYYVEKILGKKFKPDKTGNLQPFYLVKWLGWSGENNSWEPLRNLKCPELISEYESHSQLVNGEPNGIDENSDNFIDEEAWGDSEDILEKVPCNMYPTRVIGVLPQNGELLYLIALKWKKKPDDGKSCLMLIKPHPFKEEYPEILIQYYEMNTKLCDDKRDETTIAEKAEQAFEEYKSSLQNGNSCDDSSESDEERRDVKVPLLDSETSSDEESTCTESESDDDKLYTYTQIFPEDD